jgi:hypothetical protein
VILGGWDRPLESTANLPQTKLVRAYLDTLLSLLNQVHLSGDVRLIAMPVLNVYPEKIILLYSFHYGLFNL